MDKNLLKYRLTKARETLEDAKLLLSENRLNSTMNRLYYSLFYAVLALLETKGFASSKHSGVRSLFNEHFVKKGIVSRELGQFYGELFKERQKGDYTDYTTFSPEKVRGYMGKCILYLSEIESVVNKLI